MNLELWVIVTGYSPIPYDVSKELEEAAGVIVTGYSPIPYDPLTEFKALVKVIVTGYSPIPYDYFLMQANSPTVIVTGYSPIPYDRYATKRLRHNAGALFVGLFFCQIPCFMRRQMLFFRD